LYTLPNVPDCVGNVASGGVTVMFGFLEFLNRNARVAVVVGVALGAIGAAASIGWITAPI